MIMTSSRKPSKQNSPSRNDVEAENNEHFDCENGEKDLEEEHKEEDMNLNYESF